LGKQARRHRGSDLELPPEFLDGLSMEEDVPISMALRAPPISGRYVHDAFLQLHVPPSEGAKLTVPKTRVRGNYEKSPDRSRRVEQLRNIVRREDGRRLSWCPKHRDLEGQARDQLLLQCEAKHAAQIPTFFVDRLAANPRKPCSLENAELVRSETAYGPISKVESQSPDYTFGGLNAGGLRCNPQLRKVPASKLVEARAAVAGLLREKLRPNLLCLGDRATGRPTDSPSVHTNINPQHPTPSNNPLR